MPRPCGWGQRKRVIANGDGISLWGDENVLKVDCSDNSQFCEHTETYFKRVNLMICKLYPNKTYKNL